jgi:hypothetical protein
MSSFIERMFTNHTLFGVAQFRKNVGKQIGYFSRKYEDALTVIIATIAIVAIITAIVVPIRQDISRNIAREATQYSYKVGQVAKCFPEAGVGEFFTISGTGWVACTIKATTPDHRYYYAQYTDPNSFKLDIRKFSIQNISVQ